MRNLHHGQSIELAVGQQIRSQGLFRVRVQCISGQVEVGLLGLRPLLNLTQLGIADLRDQAGQNALDRPGTLHVGMVVVMQNDRMQVHDAVIQRQQDVSEVHEGTRKPLDPLDVVVPKGTYSWPAGMLDKIASTLKPAGVLIPVRHRDNGLSVLLTQRSADLKHHAGQVSFPGGGMEDHDTDIVATALREAHEEVGIHPELVDIAGYLNPTPTITGFAVTPVIGFVHTSFELRVDPTEVEKAFEVPLEFLMTPANHQRYSVSYEGKARHFYAMPYGERYIWGATAGILRVMYERLYAE